MPVHHSFSSAPFASTSASSALKGCSVIAKRPLEIERPSRSVHVRLRQSIPQDEVRSFDGIQQQHTHTQPTSQRTIVDVSELRFIKLTCPRYFIGGHIVNAKTCQNQKSRRSPKRIWR